MGIDIRSKLMVGADYEDLSEWIDNKVQENCEDGDSWDEGDVIEEYFERMSPWYDAATSECFLGFSVPNDKPASDALFKKIKELADEFEQLTGVDAVLRGGAHVY